MTQVALYGKRRKCLSFLPLLISSTSHTELWRNQFWITNMILIIKGAFIFPKVRVQVSTPHEENAKGNVFTKTIPLTHSGSRVKADVINYALTLSVCTQIWSPSPHLPHAVLGNSLNNHPMTVKNRPSIIGGNKYPVPTGYVSRLHRASF